MLSSYVTSRSKYSFHTDAMPLDSRLNLLKNPPAFPDNFNRHRNILDLYLASISVKFTFPVSTLKEILTTV